MENKKNYTILSPEEFQKINEEQDFKLIKQLTGSWANLYKNKFGQYYVQPNPSAKHGVLIDNEMSLNDLLSKGCFPTTIDKCIQNTCETNINEVICFNSQSKQKIKELSNTLNTELELGNDLNIAQIDKKFTEFGRSKLFKKHHKNLIVFIGEIVKNETNSEWFFIVDYDGLNPYYLPKLIDNNNMVYEVDRFIELYINDKSFSLENLLFNIKHFKLDFNNFGHYEGIIRIENRN